MADDHPATRPPGNTRYRLVLELRRLETRLETARDHLRDAARVIAAVAEDIERIRQEESRQP